MNPHAPFVDLEFLGDALAHQPTVEAAALYGSAARGDLESHSDIDVLLVCMPSQKLATFNHVKQILDGQSEKLSVTVYSPQELRFLRSEKSLFLLHLSREARLLFDRSGLLTSLLSGFEPKRSYAPDFQKSLSLLDPLASVVASSPNNRHRLSYLYSLFRVFGVYLLAELGIYEFSKSRMAEALAQRFPESEPAVRLLSNLRALNSNFFSGGANNEGRPETNGTVGRYLTALGTVAGVTVEASPVTYSEAVHLFEAALGRRTRPLDYRLRMWFLLLVYDGLNAYCANSGRGCLYTLSESSLLALSHDAPPAIHRACEETIDYLHRYPLKYFLTDDKKIPTNTAQLVLQGICNELPSD